MSVWDLTALVNAANAKAGQADRNLWLVRLMEWLRHAPRNAVAAAADEARTPLPVLRLRHLLNHLDKNEAARAAVQGMMRAFRRETDAAALYADFGFGSRMSLAGELLTRVQARVLPATPDTRDLAALFRLMFEAADADWIAAIDTATLHRAGSILAPAAEDWRATLLDAITILVSAVHAAGYSPALRQRMDTALLHDEPFRQLTAAAGALRTAVLEGRHAEALQEAAYLRALLDTCRRAAGSITAHLEQYGVSVDIVFDLDQLQGRARRIEQLLECVLAPDPAPQWQRLVAALARELAQVRGVRRLLARQYSLLARQVTERSAETGEHYITRTRDEYRDMLRRAAGGGAVLAGTTFVKFAIAAIGLSAFWAGFWSGANYAASFVVVMLLHWTVATKQPAMTAPALAASLPAAGGSTSEEQIETFVDRVAQLIRSQAAGIVGNVAMCAPLVLAAQWLAKTVFGAPLVGAETAEYVLGSLTLLGPTVLFAAFTGVLLFASSLVAGWAENWFVLHRLDSAMAWNPRIVATLGAARARRWSSWSRANVSGLAANISLGMMLGLAPALVDFLGPPLEVRHVTLSSGQLGAALGALGWPLLAEPAFWWCMAGIAATGVLNVTVSFWLAFKVALSSRGVRLKDRSRIAAAMRRRLFTRPLSFVWPPRD
ncbi:MAG: recombinase [Rubrivivax sp.]|jgi:site-specific recombinase|nr:recombinase [Betaproteobacteria bacterium]MBP6317170.1 recombinase [Rubrivivax sp.]MBK7277814.1 recombinase [Betaproteobacteria bacterium]MBK7457735.1 recombinase [Betaproteobacteria bacterium]MBK7514058.1 recombinase [Betaproteobacteria bacterium]